MQGLDLIATAAFGLESVVKREIEALGFPVTDTRDGRVTYRSDAGGIVASNLWLRSADRVFVRLAEFEARSFEALFDGCQAAPWEEWIHRDGVFPVTGSTVKSTLRSLPDCQSIIKKAVVKRLSSHYGIDRFPESGATFPIRFSLLKDRVTLLLDTSGAGLHKRGYRVRDVAAPMKETLAAALVLLSFYRADRTLADPFCGSGTLAIEAAMIGRNIAPGLSRDFCSQAWEAIPQALWKEGRAAAFSAIDYDRPLRILASDIDGRAVEAALANAAEAGVDDCIDFSTAPFQRFAPSDTSGILITNPPYGGRIDYRGDLDSLYRSLNRFLAAHPYWSLFLLTADKDFEQVFGRPANRRRKLYNGRIQTCYYQYHGQRPQV